MKNVTNCRSSLTICRGRCPRCPRVFSCLTVQSTVHVLCTVITVMRMNVCHPLEDWEIDDNYARKLLLKP